MKISNSRFDTYHRCPYAHYLRYYEGLSAKYKGRPLSFGSDFHTLLQYRGDKQELKKAKREIKKVFYDLSPAQQQIIGGEDYLTDLTLIFSDYRKVYKDSPMPTFTEREFSIKVGDYKGEPIIFNGIIDGGFVYRKSGQKVVDIEEHKTFGRKPDMNTLVMNTQKCMYAKAYHFKTGILPQRVIWDYICSTPAAEPVYLVNSNRFSLAASKKITPYSYLRACDRHEIDDPTIRAEAERYQSSLGEFFFQVPQDVVPTMVDTVWDGFMYTARDIIRQGYKNKTRYLTRDCVWCDFKDVCNAELSGYSAKDIIKRNFTQEDRD